jgi:hypothetical protein
MFQQSKLNLMEFVLLTYDTVHRVPAHTIQQEHQFGSATITDWSKLCREVTLDYVLGSSQKIGGSNKTVENDESMFGLRKYDRGLKVKGQWVFVGVEREFGKDISGSCSGQNRQNFDGCSS